MKILLLISYDMLQQKFNLYLQASQTRKTGSARSCERNFQQMVASKRKRR
jgi:hypothetical protein